MDYGRSWSSQEWKSEAAAHDRSGKLVEISWNAMQQVRFHREEPLLGGNAHSARYGETIHDGSGKTEKLNHQEVADSETFVMGSDAAEFVNKVKDQVRKDKRMSNVAESGEQHSIIWRMFMAETMNAATFMGKNFMVNENSIKNSGDLTLKHMFDITSKFVSEQEEIKGHLLVQVLKRSGILRKTSPQGVWDHIADELLLEFAESGHPIFRATTPLSWCKLKSKGHVKLFIHFNADDSTIETIFRIIVSVNQFSPYGAVANMCEEFETHQDRSGEPEILMGQSIVLGEVKAKVPVQNENPPHHHALWQQYDERIKLLSQESKVSKFCMDAGFLRVVEVGQYFMTMDTGDFRQPRAVACREYTLPRDDEPSQPRGRIQGNSRVGPVLEVTTSYLWGKHGIEIRIWSLSQDNSHSWVRISHGENKYVVDVKLQQHRSCCRST